MLVQRLPRHMGCHPHAEPETVNNMTYRGGDLLRLLFLEIMIWVEKSSEPKLNHLRILMS